MAKSKGIPYDVRGVDSAGGDFELPPVGLYRCKIVEAEWREDKNDLHVTLEITHDSKGKKVKKDYSRLHRYFKVGKDEAGVGFFRQFLEALGMLKSKKDEKGTLNPQKFVGEDVLVRVRHEPWTEAQGGDGTPRAKIGNIMPLDAEEEDDDDDDDDDDSDDSDDDDDDDDDEEEDDDEDEDEDEDDDEDEDEDDEDEDEDDDDEEDDGPDYSSMSLKELTALVKENEGDPKKIIGKATKAPTKKKKLAEWLEENAEGDDEEPDYEEWSPKELKAELEERGLKTSGKKEVLVKRLEKDDESDDDEPF